MNFNINTDSVLRILIKIIIVLCIVCLILFAVFLLCRSCAPENTVANETETDFETQSTPVQNVILNTVNEYDADYIEKIIFLGESTTAHMRSRGVLPGGTNTTQVWSDASNTMTLDINTASKKIVYPDTGAEMTIAEAVAKKKPEYMVLTFGLNGVTGFYSNKNLYVTSYERLIEAIRQNSPETKIIIQSIFPVSSLDLQSNWAYSSSPEVINGYLDTLNEWAIEVAQKCNVKYIDTASLLKDSQGYLKSGYQTDGIHLTAEAYKIILNYIGTHKYM